MGFSDDDAIRSKNKSHQEAYELYEKLLNVGFTEEEVVKHANLSLQTTSDESRFNLFKEILKICERKANVEVTPNGIDGVCCGKCHGCEGD